MIDENLMRLADELEGASEGSRDLDARVFVAVGGFADRDGPRDPTDWNALAAAPRYTTSLDAALTLVPAGYHVELGIYTEPGERDGDSIEPGCHAYVTDYAMGDGPYWEPCSEATTLPLALTIEVLRVMARQHKQTDPNASDSQPT